MEDDSKFGHLVKWGLGAVGLGGVAAVISVPSSFKIWVAVAILLLFVLVFGGYFLWRRMRARRQSKMFSSALEAQTGAAPRAISDPNQRAALDKLRQKFQTGLQEFKTHGKDIYKLPWYAIIGESGSGKSEAIRHSGIEFPPGLQDKMQGSGGTVNMDWWFTNRAIILDTAGSMIFRETQAGDSPEWAEFLRLLKKSRPQCPINGLFLVLSVESLIHDSADKISEKASKLAQQLQLIQRTLDVRFPVYLLVTKSDLMTGFREFFDSIEDPLLQHQMFGWSNPDALDSPLRPELVEQHLKSVADRLRRRRLALILREPSSGARLGETTFFTASSQPLGGRGGQRRLDDMDALFALPESVMRLVPRLRRYLETVFVAGEWSAKPVFLRGIYFTSSMREGKALDEAMALATGLSVDQLPEDRSWEKNRAFFLRDLFVEKVFSESGLVTRATNTIQLLRKRQFAIFGTAGVALLLLIVLAGFGYRNLKRNVLVEAADWEAGVKGWNQGDWSPSIIRAGTEDAFHYAYAGTNREAQVGAGNLSVVEYHQRLKEVVSKKLGVSLIFRPLLWFGFGNVNKQDRANAQRVLFEQGVLKPLVVETRKKLQNRQPTEKTSARHQGALLALIQLEADRFATNVGYLSGTNAAATYLNSFVSYLTDSDTSPVDTNLVSIFAWTYSKGGSGDGKWPPPPLLAGDDLASNTAIMTGLKGLREANLASEKRITDYGLPALNQMVTDFVAYRKLERNWLADPTGSCDAALTGLEAAMRALKESESKFFEATKGVVGRPLTNLTECYDKLAVAAASASGLSIEDNLKGFSEKFRTSRLHSQIDQQLKEFRSAASSAVKSKRTELAKDLAELDLTYTLPVGGESVYDTRWSLYLAACALDGSKADVKEADLGHAWERFNNLMAKAAELKTKLKAYAGPFAPEVASACERIAGRAATQLQERYVSSYVQTATNKLVELAVNAGSFGGVTNAANWLEMLKRDLADTATLKEQAGKLGPVRVALTNAYREIPQSYADHSLESLKRNLKFPVLLTASESFDEPGLKAARSTLSRLTLDLNNAAVWQSFPGSDAILQSARKNPYAEVVNALVADSGNLAEIEILFTLPAPGASVEGGLYRDPLRFANIVVNGKTNDVNGWKRPGDVSSFPEKQTSIAAKIPVNAGFRVEFFSDMNRRTRTATLGFEGGEDNWTLIRLIKAGHAEPISNKGGTEWRLKLPVTVGANQPTLEAFEIKVSSSLPKKEEWPK